MDAPAIPPGIPDRGPGFDLGEAEGATDPAGPEPEAESVLIDLDCHCAKGEYPEHRGRDDKPKDVAGAKPGDSIDGHPKGRDKGDAGHCSGLSVVVHGVGSSLTDCA